MDNYFDLVVTSEDAGGDKITGLPEKLLARLLDDSNPVGWSIGDQDWDHLFSKSTFFMQKSDNIKNTASNQIYFQKFSELISILNNLN